MKQNTAEWSQCVNGTEHSEMEPMCKWNRTQQNMCRCLWFLVI